MKRSHAIAIALVVIIVVGGVGVYVFLRPPPIANLIVMGTTDSIETVLDPARAYDYFGWSMIGALGSGLVDIEPGSTAAPDDIIPSLAASWTASGAGSIYDFTLKQGLAFEDGTPFNSTIVKYTFDRCCNLTGEGLYHPEGFQLGIGLADVIDNVTITGEYTVRFYLYFPWAPFLQTMAAQGCFMVHPTYAPMDQLVNYTAGNARASHAVGLGPYLLQSWSRTGGTDEEIVLVRNPDYWDAANGIPKTDTFIIKFYETDTALATAMTAGEISQDYETNTGLVIARRYEQLDPASYPGVLVAGHGPFCWGNTPRQASRTAVLLEEIARIAYHTMALNPSVESISQPLLDKHFLRKHGPEAYYGQE